MSQIFSWILIFQTWGYRFPDLPEVMAIRNEENKISVCTIWKEKSFFCIDHTIISKLIRLPRANLKKI